MEEENRENSKKVSVIIPARNGEEFISKNISIIRTTFQFLNIGYEIIIIDDCSWDDTFLNLQKEKDIIYYRKVVRQGKGSAIKTGLKLAKNEFITVMDADLQIKPEEIKTFFKLMDLYNADAVIGNKRHNFSNSEYSFFRNIISNGYNLMVKILFRLPLRDTQCGFKLFKKEVLNKIMGKILVKEFAFDLEVLVALKENNFRVVDAPVYVTKPLGAGSVNIKSILETFKDTLAVWIREKGGWYKNGD